MALLPSIAFADESPNENKFNLNVRRLGLDWAKTNIKNAAESTGGKIIDAGNRIIEKSSNAVGNIADSIAKITYSYESAVEAIKNLGDNANSIKVNEIIKNVDTVSGRIGVTVWYGFNIIGGYIAKALDIIGNLLGSLISKISNGVDNIDYCIDVIKNNGFSGFLADGRCMVIVGYTILYTIMCTVILKILKYILRKISSITGWLGGRSK